jgi:DNA-binding LacI/PurR family transcriptional regulator
LRTGPFRLRSATIRNQRDKGQGRPPTLADVAGKLGVSEATVSLVVNDHPRISARTKVRVWRCIRELGYRPDPIGRALVTGRSSLIGLLVPDTGNPFFADIFRGAEDAAREKGYHILLNNGSYRLDLEEQRVEELLDLKVGGLIVGPAFTDARQARRAVWERLRKTRFPVVLLNRQMEPAAFHQVSPDNVQGVRLSSEHLASLGHTRVAYISGIPEVLPVRQRLAAYKECAARLGFAREAGLIETSPFTATGGYEACRRLWRRLRRKPTAIMALTDTVATGVLKFLSSEGVKVPDDVSLMGFDGTPQAQFSLIGISTIEAPLYEMGKKAVQMLDQAIKAPTGELASVVLPVRLVVRESTGPVSR